MQLRRKNFCESCGAKAVAVDHIRPFNEQKGDRLRYFFNMDNLQSLCKSCHARKSQSEKSRYKRHKKLEGLGVPLASPRGVS